MEDWIAKISFHAALPPSMQLKSFEERHQIDPVHMSATPSPPPPSRPFEAPPPPPVPPLRDTFSDRKESANDSGFLSPEKSAGKDLDFEVAWLKRKRVGFLGPYQSPPQQPPPPVPVRQFSLTKTTVSVNGDHEKAIQYREDGLLDKVRNRDLNPKHSYKVLYSRWTLRKRYVRHRNRPLYRPEAPRHRHPNHPRSAVRAYRAPRVHCVGNKPMKTAISWLGWKLMGPAGISR